MPDAANMSRLPASAELRHGVMPRYHVGLSPCHTGAPETT
jgi:hypothetical protein